MFDKSLKKKLKARALQKHIGNLQNSECLLITCGDNNGATNHYLRQLGGNWTWGDFDGKCIPEMELLLEDTVHRLDDTASYLPFGDQKFDLVVSIDVHEHLQDPAQLTRDLYRILKSGGRAIVTTPNGNERKLAVRIKHFIGMTPDRYGHRRLGFDIPDLEALLTSASFTPYSSSSYSKFFTEILELLINSVYVKLLAKRSSAKVEQGTIAPVTRNQLNSVGTSYKIYSLAYPLFWAISQLDRLLVFSRGYAVIVEARR